MTVMGDALVDGLSDAGSTPARSITCGKEGPTKWEDSLLLGIWKRMMGYFASDPSAPYPFFTEINSR